MAQICGLGLMPALGRRTHRALTRWGSRTRALKVTMAVAVFQERREAQEIVWDHERRGPLFPARRQTGQSLYVQLAKARNSSRDGAGLRQLAQRLERLSRRTRLAARG